VVFDRATWRALADELGRILDWVQQLELESLERAGADRSGLLPTALGMACFRSPPL
jgi:hypothetical protein